MKKVLPYIISHNQSVFVLGHLITDNIIVTFEALRNMDVKLKGIKPPNIKYILILNFYLE